MKDNERWSHNVVNRLKLDINSVGNWLELAREIIGPRSYSFMWDYGCALPRSLILEQMAVHNIVGVRNELFN